MAPKTAAGSQPTHSTETPPANSAAASAGADPQSTAASAAVNKKKQKRRQKQAARQAATDEDPQGGDEAAVDNNPLLSNGDTSHVHSQHDHEEPGSHAYSGDENSYPYEAEFGAANGSFSNAGRSQGKKKKKSKAAGTPVDSDIPQDMPPPPIPAPLPPRPISDDALRTVSRNIKEGSIWDTNGPEERSRIKAFWLGLTEKERKDLVNIEKSHVLQKMKEQQKHSCSCTVCGRKRTAIEEELEVLLKDPRIWADPTTEPPSDRLPSSLAAGFPPRRRIQEIQDDEDGEFADDEPDEDDYNSEEYDEDEDEEYLSDGDEIPANVASDFFQFGNSLTVKADGILTVADDLLKNDGQKFIDMMEQLAERRMQREEDARYHAAHYASQRSMSPQHNHPVPAGHLPPEEEEYEDEEEDDYDDDDVDYEDEEDEMDAMTEDQRMEEGRRMFQIFAARMFEQRVVTAYREKVAWERQQELINEQEKDATGPSDAKKAKNAEKKKRQRLAAKEAKAQKEAAKEEERQRREAATREAEEKKREEQRQKQEEQRRKREAERQAQEDKRRKKEAEVQKKLEVERERQQEQERRKAEEKRKREEAERKKREEREAKEKEEREKKAQEENERKEREARATAEKEAQEKKRVEEQTTKAPQTQESSARGGPPPTVVALPPTSKSRNSHDSPSAKIATPALPKAPTPSRNKEPPSRRTSTPHTPERTPLSKASSPPITTQPSFQPPQIPLSRPQQQNPPSSFATQMSPVHSISPPGMPPVPQQQAGSLGGVPSMGMNGYPGFQGQMPPGMNRMAQGQQMPMFSHGAAPQPIGSQTRHGMPVGPHNVGSPGATSSQPQLQRTRGFPDVGPNAFTQQPPVLPSAINQPGYTTGRDMPPPSAPHSRQSSNQFDLSVDTQSISSTAPQPIGRPAPMKRPPSGNRSQDRGPEGSKALSAGSEVDDLSNHLGSSALLDDSDEPLPSAASENRRQSAAPGSMRSSNSAIGSPYESVASSFTSFGTGGGLAPGDNWGRVPMSHFGPPGMPPPGHSQTSGWGGLGPGSTPLSGTASAGGWNSSTVPTSQAHSFNLPIHNRSPPGNRPAQVRTLAVQACKTLMAQSSGIENSGFFDFSDVVRHTVESGRQMRVDPGIQLTEIRNILDTEGDRNNGGGTFQVRAGEMKISQGGRTLVRWVPEQGGASDSPFGQQYPFQPQQPYQQHPGGGLQGGPFGASGVGSPRQGLGLDELGSPTGETRLPNLGSLGRLQ